MTTATEDNTEQSHAIAAIARRLGEVRTPTFTHSRLFLFKFASTPPTHQRK